MAFLVCSDSRSGTYYRYHNLARGLVELGHQVTIHSQSVERRDRATVETRDGVRYVLPASFPGNAWIDFSLNPGNLLRRACSKVPPADVYHLFQPVENAALQWLWLRRRRRSGGALFAWDWDDLWFGGLVDPAKLRTQGQRWRARLYNYMERCIPSGTELVTTCSEFLASLASERGARESVVIHNGFWPDRAGGELAPDGDDRRAIRRTFRLEAGAFYLGFIGWTPVALDWCFETLRRLPASPGCPPVRLACSGYDIRRDLDQHPDIADRVDYLGELSTSDARRLMRVLDLGLLPLTATKFNESRLPIKFAEYLAAGLPEVCSDIGESGRLGRELDGVVLCQPERGAWVECCAATAQRLMTNPGSICPNARQLFARLGWPVLAAQLESLYLRDRRGPGSSGDTTNKAASRRVEK